MRKLWLLLGFLLVSLVGVTGPALAQTGTVTATVRPNPLEVELTAPQSVIVSDWFNITASVSNKGGEVIRQTRVALNTPPKITARGVKKSLGNLQPGETKTVSWQAKAKSAGNFVVVAEATGKLAGEPISASDSTLISVVGSLARFWLKVMLGV